MTEYDLDHPARSTRYPVLVDDGSFAGTYQVSRGRYMPDRYGEWCWWCRLRPADGMDHLTPRSRGGTNDESNLVPACSRCNSAKGTKTASEYGAWLVERARVLATTCPRCGASCGEWCRHPSKGRHVYNLHPERRVDN